MRGRRLHGFSAAMGVLCLAQSAAAQAPPAPVLAATPPRVTVTDPDAAARVTPVLALAAGVSGGALLSCAVEANGRAMCVVKSETPERAGFGAAALDLVRSFSFTPKTIDGAPVASTMDIPVKFPAEAGPVDLVFRTLVTGDAGGAATIDPAAPLADPYPAEALARRTEGYAVVACVDARSLAPRCAVEKAYPADAGFETAALRVAAATVRPMYGDVQRVPVVFTIKGTARAKMWAETAWAERPTARSFDRFTPAKAAADGVNGRVMLSCSLRADLRLDCSVASEKPGDYGHGDAALKVARDFKMREEAMGPLGFQVGDRISIPITFQIMN